MFEQYADNLSQIIVYPDDKLFRLTFDSTVGKLRILSKRNDIFEELRTHFSADNPATFFVKQYGYKAEPKIYAINKFGYFGNGLVWEIFKYIKEQYGDLSVIAISKNCKTFLDEQLMPLRSFIQQMSKQNWQISNIADDSGRNNERKNSGKPEFTFRDYQENSIKQLLLKGFGRGLIEIPTAGGKSFILANFCWNLHKHYNRQLKCLILVPNKQLVNQMYSDFIDYGYDPHNITRFTAGLKKHEAFNPDAKIIVANRQYVFKNEKLLPITDVLICDEAHQCLSDATMAFIERLQTPIKIGCSGTLPRDKFQKWKILGLFSRIVYTEEITELQKRGFISKLKITLLKIFDTYVDKDTNILFNLNTTRKYCPDEFGYSEIAFDDANKAEHEYFAKHYKELYKPVLEYIAKLQGNTLILFDKLDIGKSLFGYFTELYKDKNAFYTDGSTDVAIRENIRQYLETQSNNFLFANVQIMSTGINIKKLNTVVFCFSSKSTVRIIQSVGRILRLHTEKDYAHLIDCVFNTKYSTKHFKERCKLYKDFYNKKEFDIIEKFTI